MSQIKKQVDLSRLCLAIGKDANKGSCPTMVKEILEPSIQARIYQLCDEYEKNSQSVLRFEKRFKDLMRYIPDDEIDNYFELEEMFHAKSKSIELAYRAAVDEILTLK
ncbi:hypothetical protein M5W75_16480 [Paenibacillus larvae]|nr:hypothetical protein [Paenibacillus larvae]MCY9751390.1 hypothetical protein [Paenibacillus larvae]MEC0185220.1 hypothetical protein [Paenibacillus larvae]